MIDTELRCDIEIGARSFEYSAPILCNRFPRDVKYIKNINTVIPRYMKVRKVETQL